MQAVLIYTAGLLSGVAISQENFGNKRAAFAAGALSAFFAASSIAAWAAGL